MLPGSLLFLVLLHIHICAFGPEGWHTQRPVLAWHVGMCIAVGDSCPPLDAAGLAWLYLDPLSISFDGQRSRYHYHDLVKIRDLCRFAPGRRSGHVGEAKIIIFCVEHAKVLIDNLAILAWKNGST